MIVLSLLALLPPTPLQGESRLETFPIDGAARKAQVHPGAAASPPSGRPLVFAFHGHGGSIASSVRQFAIHTLWPEAIVVYPEGLPTPTRRDPQGARRGWQNLRGENGDRDLKFFDAILKRVKGFDPKRVYAIGHSNGGAFTFLLWAERRDVFAAFGVSGASGGRSLPRLAPAPAFLTVGEKDPIASPERQLATIATLQKLNSVDLSTAKADGPTRVAKGAKGVELGSYVHPGGHELPREAIRATVDFFRRQSR